MLKLLDNLSDVGAKQEEIADSAGALGTGWKTATANASDQIALMHQNLDSLYDAMATPAIPTETRLFGYLTDKIRGATEAAKQHGSVTGDTVIGMSVLGHGVLAGVEGLSTLGSASIFAGEGAKFLGKTWTIATDFQAWGLRAMYLNDKIHLTTIATKLWAGAQWLLNAAMDANPIVLITAGAIALAVAAYEIYKHWGAIAGFFEKVWGDIKGIFTGAWHWMETAGVNLMKSLGEGILAGAEYPFKAAWGIAEKIGRHFIGHSPPPEGPLHELGRITIAETIAEHIRAVPIISAVKRTAAAVAIAAPMMAGAGGAAMAGAIAPGGAPSIVINAPITINASGGDSAALEKIVVKGFERHRYELLRALESEQARRERSNLS
jgi:hypothetical protein